MKISTAFVAFVTLNGIVPMAHARLAYRLEHISKSGKSSKTSSKSSKSTSKSGNSKSLKWIDEGCNSYKYDTSEISRANEHQNYYVEVDDGYYEDDANGTYESDYANKEGVGTYYQHDDNYYSKDGSMEEYAGNIVLAFPERPNRWPTKIPTSYPTAPPTDFPTLVEIEQASINLDSDDGKLFHFLSKISDPNALRDDSSPQGKARAWLSNQDDSLPDDDELSHHNLVLAQTYVLVAFYHALGGEGWLETTNWLSHKSVCLWVGIDCSAMDGSLVKSITLPMNNLDGSLALVEDELSSLKNFRELILNDNWISGSFPMGLSESIFRINLSNNRMGGEIDFNRVPKEKLISFKVAGNSFSGSMNGLAERTGLKQIDLRDNDFQGTISNAFGNLASLMIFRIENNSKLSGSMPSSVCSLLDPLGGLVQLTASCDPSDNFECPCCTQCH